MLKITTPILFLIFNRPNTTIQVLQEIRKVAPSRPYIACDGARTHKEGEKEKVQETRELVLKNIDWECEVKTLFRDNNLGCKEAVSGAISWFFENEEMGIILEDDCLPSQSFFPFCEELLIKYKEDTRIWLIGGTNFLSKFHLENSPKYYFSKYDRSWGWASWRRAWKNYDKKLSLWPEIKNKNVLKNILYSDKEAKMYNHIFEQTYQGKIDTWDYQWLFAVLINNGLSIIPETNLISNIGFGGDATHTFNGEHPYANLNRGEVLFPLQHPSTIIPDFEKDIIYSQLAIKEQKTQFQAFFSMLCKGEFRKIITKIHKHLK